MRLENAFTVPAPVPEAWQRLLDVPTVAPCMPGATLTDYDGDRFTGTVKVKLGPIGLTYRGTGTFTERDETAHRAVIEASGRETRGPGTAAATLTATLAPDAAGTRVTVVTDLTVTGRPAQFGRSMLADVSAKLIDRFAERLATEMRATHDTEPETASSAGPAAGDSGSGATAPDSPTPGRAGSTARTPTTATGTAGTGSGRARGGSATGSRAGAGGSAAGGGAGTSGSAAGAGTAAESVAAHTNGHRPIDAVSTAARNTRRAETDDAIDLLEVTGANALARKALPYLAAFAAGCLVTWLITRRH